VAPPVDAGVGARPARRAAARSGDEAGARLRVAHRWLSRRSVLLTTHCSRVAAEEVWLASAEFRRFDERAAGLGARARVERLRAA